MLCILYLIAHIALIIDTLKLIYKNNTYIASDKHAIYNFVAENLVHQLLL